MNPTALTTTEASFLPHGIPRSVDLADADVDGSWTKLPEDVILKFFEYLSYKDARQCMLINKRMCDIMQRNSIVPRLFYRQFAPNTAQPILPPHENYQENIRPWLVESNRHHAISRLNSLAERCAKKPLIFKYELFYAVSKIFKNATHYEVRQIADFAIPTVITVSIELFEWHPYEDNILLSYKLMGCNLVHIRKKCLAPIRTFCAAPWYSEHLQSSAYTKVQFHDECAYVISTETNLVNQTGITIIRCYRRYTLEHEQRIKYALSVKLCEFNSDASCLAVVLADESIKIFTRDEQNTWQICQKIYFKDATIGEVAFSHDNDTMLIICDCLCRFLQINKSKKWEVRQIIGFEESVLSAQFSPNSRSLVITTTQNPGGDNGSDESFLVHFYSRTPSEWIESQLIECANKPTSFAFSPNSRHIIINFSGGSHRVFFFDDDQDQWVEKRMSSSNSIAGELIYRNGFSNHELVRKPALHDGKRDTYALVKIIAR